MVANDRPEGTGLLQMIIQKVAFFLLYVHYLGSNTQPKKHEKLTVRLRVCVYVSTLTVSLTIKYPFLRLPLELVGKLKLVNDKPNMNR